MLNSIFIYLNPYLNIYKLIYYCTYIGPQEDLELLFHSLTQWKSINEKRWKRRTTVPITVNISDDLLLYISLVLFSVIELSLSVYCYLYLCLSLSLCLLLPLSPLSFLCHFTHFLSFPFIYIYFLLNHFIQLM